jgi:prolyl 4-hydroxylase
MILSIAPRIVFIENALSPEDCSSIINSNVEFVPSGVDYRGNEVVDATIRSSYNYIDHQEKFGFLKKIAIDLAEKHAPNENLNYVSEPISVQRYEITQQFSQHCDYGPNGKRHVTVIFYLNDDFQGGHTLFELLSLSVKPIAGSCLIFYYDSYNEQMNRLTRHGGDTVTDGTKYIATAWLRNHETS